MKKESEINIFICIITTTMLILCIICTCFCKKMMDSIDRISHETIISNDIMRNINYNESSALSRNYRHSTMVSFEDNGISSTPVSATIVDKVVTIELKLTNKTNRQIEIQDYATINFGGYEIPCDITSDNYTIPSGNEQNIKITFDITALEKLNVVPTETILYLGAYTNGIYQKYDIKTVISWKEY